MVELQLGDGGTGAPNVAGGSVRQEVLPGAIVAAHLGGRRPVQEGLPGQLVQLGVVRSGGVTTRDGDVVAGVGNQHVNEQAACLSGGESLLDRVQYGLRGAGMSPR